ncbi:hypothetical protein [Cerasicoccus frondis]|uniref:hypothetical protein n=1 Tax=Cerasicoccus frondis TaxID=490090 RepID=UPI0028526E5A|nr:hypothetical protein [Cerasicoccus frondis]
MAEKNEETDTKVEPELANEINAAVEDSLKVEPAEDKGGDKPKSEEEILTPDDDVPGGDNQEEDSPGEENNDEGEGKPKTDTKDEPDGKKVEESDITDAHVERAIKAGMSISEARSFKDAKSLERIVGLLEARQKDVNQGADKPKEEEASESDPLADIPDLDPEEYDEGIIKGFNAMKSIIASQQKTIREQSESIKAIQGSGQQSWFDSQVSALEVPDSDKTAKRDDLKTKFDVLSAGYKAAGQDVSQDTIFEEAVGMVLGDSVRESKEQKKADALKKRNGQHTQRPTGAKPKPSSDVESETAKQLDRKFFGQS